MLAVARSAVGHGVPEGTVLTWSRHFACADEAPVTLTPVMIEQRHVIATGLANTHHLVRVTVAPDAPAVREVRVYQPDL